MQEWQQWLRADGAPIRTLALGYGHTGASVSVCVGGCVRESGVSVVRLCWPFRGSLTPCYKDAAAPRLFKCSVLETQHPGRPRQRPPRAVITSKKDPCFLTTITTLPLRCIFLFHFWTGNLYTSGSTACKVASVGARRRSSAFQKGGWITKIYFWGREGEKRQS